MLQKKTNSVKQRGEGVLHNKPPLSYSELSLLLSSTKVHNNRSPSVTPRWWNLYESLPDAGSCPGLSPELTALSALESITRRSPGLRLGTAIRYFCHSAWLWLRLSVALDKPVTHPGLDFLSVKTMKEYCRDQVTRGLEETPTVSGRQLHRQLEHGTYYQKSKSCQFRLD